MKVRNKEDRSSAIWRFVTVATFAGLLLLLGGFSAGRTFKKFNEDYFSRYYGEVGKVAALEQKMADQELLFINADSVVQVFITEIERLDKGLTDAAKNDLVTREILSKINADAYIALNDFEEDYAVMKSKLPPDDAVTMIGFSSLKKYADQHFYALNHQLDGLIEMIKKGQEDLLGEKIDELNKKQEELEKATVAIGEKEEKATVKTQLAECKAQLETLRASGSKSYKGEFTIIETNVAAIKRDVIPYMKGKLIGKNSERLDELKDILDGHLDIIMSAANKIE